MDQLKIVFLVVLVFVSISAEKCILFNNKELLNKI